MLYDGIPKAYHAQILSCFSHGACVWLITWLVLSTFWLSPPIFFTRFQTRLGPPHLQLHASLAVCAHIPLTSWVSTSYVAPMAISTQKPMIQFTTIFPSFCEMFISTWENITCVSFKYIQLLSLMNQHCAHKKWNLHFNWCCHYWPNTCKKSFHDLVQFKDLLPLMHLKPKKGTIMTKTPLVNSSLQQLKYLDVYIAGKCVFISLCQCHLELQRAKGPSFSCFDYFSSSQKFNYIAKDASTLYLESTNNVSLTTSWLPPLHGTPYHHSQPIM